MKNSIPYVFLSAGVPEKFLDDGVLAQAPDVLSAEPELIRESILALVVICAERGCGLVFGGHPAISPLVYHAAIRLNTIQSVQIYQSEYYLDQPNVVPPEAWQFPNLHPTRRKQSRDESLSEMREQMIDNCEWNFIASIYIGGEEGIHDEFRRFATAYDAIPQLPLHSPGGAARELFDRRFSQLPPDLQHDLSPEGRLPYKQLFRECLSKIA